MKVIGDTMTSSTPDFIPLDSIKGTPVYDIDVGWSDDPQKGNQMITLFSRHQYLRLMQQLPEVTEELDENGNPIPIDPAEPDVHSFPASPQYVLADVYNAVAGADSSIEEIMNGLLELSDSGRLSPPMVQSIDRLILTLRIAGVISGVTPAVPRYPPETTLPTQVDYVPPKVVMGGGDLTTTLTIWRDIPGIDKILNDALGSGVNARIIQRSEPDQFANTSLQHLIRFEYVQRGNNIMFNALADLHDSLDLVEETLGLLNRVGDILNQKDPEKATLDLQSLVNINRNESGYLVDATAGKGDDRDPESYAAALDAWESRQFNRELGRVVLPLGDENEGFINSYDQKFGLISGTKTEHETPQVDTVRVGSSNDEFEGQVQNLEDGLSIVQGTVRISAKVEGNVVEIFSDEDMERLSDNPNDSDYNIGILKGNLGKDGQLAEGRINYLTGEWHVEFNYNVLDDQNINIDYKQPETFRVKNVVAAVGDSVSTDFTGKITTFPILEDAFVLTDGIETFTAQGAGPVQNLVGDHGGTGTVNVETGEWSVTFANPPLTGARIFYQYDHRQVIVNQRILASGDASRTNFQGVETPNDPGEFAPIVPYPITPGSVVISDGYETFTPDPSDFTILIGDKGGTGTVDYDTGEWEVTFNRAPKQGSGNIIASFRHQVLTPFFITNEVLSNSSGTEFTGKIINIPLVPGSLLIRDGDVESDDDSDWNEQFKDLGNGVLQGDKGGTGTINYQTGDYTLLFHDPVDNPPQAKYEVFTGVPDDDATLLAHIGAQLTLLKNRLPDGDLKKAIEVLEQDLLGNSFVPTLDQPIFNLSVFIQDFRGSDSDDYQRHLNTAVVAAQSLNDSQKEELRRRMFEFEEFYKSASSLISKITQIIEKLAQNISR